MAKIHITNVIVQENPSGFHQPFHFELTFECIEELKDDLEWKMIYVGSAESEEHDQVLETIYVGPVPEGRHIFGFHADAPDVTKIPEADVVGVTIILITCSYREQEFVRVGYFVNNDYADPELRENPPPKPVFNKLVRNILASKPRVTRFKINWDDSPENGLIKSTHTSNGYAVDDTTSKHMMNMFNTPGAVNAIKSYNGTAQSQLMEEDALIVPIPNNFKEYDDSNSQLMDC